jgi:hypothetical protein
LSIVDDVEQHVGGIGAIREVPHLITGRPGDPVLGWRPAVCRYY